MAGTTKRSLAILGLVIASAGSMNQCAKDLARQIVPDNSFEAYLQEGFGPVSQKAVGTNDEGGQQLEIRVTSTQSKSWTQAEMLMSRKAGCGDGRSFVPEWVLPAIALDEPGNVVAAMQQSRPAGTTFVLRLSCEGPLPGEIQLDPTLGIDEAIALVSERIGGTDPYDPDGVTNLATQITLSKESRKYTAFNAFLGSSATLAYRLCRGPAVLENVAVGDLPLHEGNDSEWATGHLIVGVDFACMPRNDADAAPPVEKSPP
jgi:hypothetical protein